MLKKFTLFTAAMILAGLGSAKSQETLTGPIAAAFDMKKCVNMGNSLESGPDVEWGAPIDPTQFADIKAAGFDTVRIPVKWSAYTDDSPDHLIDPAFMADVTVIVDSALGAGLNVILNVHHFDEIMKSPKAEMRHLLAIWRQVATHFADRTDDLWFELLNEPNNKLEGKLLQAAQQVAILGIRESNPDRILILGGERWSDINSLPTNIAPPDNNIVYTVHYYDPFEFTHQFAPWIDKKLVNKKLDWGSREDRDQLTRAVSVIDSFKLAVKHPVFVGEFGVFDPVDPKERVEWVGEVRKAMEASAIPWCLWSFTNTFALYDPATGWDKDMVAALGARVPAKTLAPDTAVKRFGTRVMQRPEAKSQSADWGTLLTYFEGASWGTEAVETGVAEIKPGWEIHPPHAHAEEEYLMIIEGDGTWMVNGKTFQANTGDMLYAAPWSLHGLKNTGSSNMKFVFWKWTSSGITPPPAPPNQ